MRYYVKDINTELGLRYQVWMGDEPVSYIFSRLGSAVKFMRRLIYQSNDEVTK